MVDKQISTVGDLVEFLQTLDQDANLSAECSRQYVCGN